MPAASARRAVSKFVGQDGPDDGGPRLSQASPTESAGPPIFRTRRGLG
jgi:hypothetical protein